MKKHLTFILLRTFLISCTVTTVLLEILILNPTNKIDQGCNMSAMAFGFGLVTILFMTFGSTTIYLNLYKRIRMNYLYSLLSFLLFPLGIGIVFVLSLGDFFREWQAYMVIILPYLCILLFQYFKYQKKQKNIHLINIK